MFSDMVDERALETELQTVGRQLGAAMPVTRNPLKAFDEKAMDLASADAELKAALFRFVDVVPACRSLDDLARHLTGFLGEVEQQSPPLGVAMRMGNTKTGRTALGAAAAAGVKHMARRFIVGEDPKAALGVLRDLFKDGVASSVDLLGEATVTQAEAQRYADRCADALDTLVTAARRWPERPQLERDSAGVLARANLSVKVSALTPLLRPDAPERGKRDAADRLRPLLRQANELGAHLHIDMESMDSRDAVLELILDLLSEDDSRSTRTAPSPSKATSPSRARPSRSPAGAATSTSRRTWPAASASGSGSTRRSTAASSGSTGTPRSPRAGSPSATT